MNTNMSAEERAAEAVDHLSPQIVTEPAHADRAVEVARAEAEKLPKVQERKRSDIAVVDGKLTPQSLSESWRIAESLMHSGALPKSFQNPHQVVMGMQILRQLGLPEIAGLSKLAIINGSFSLWGEAPLGLVFGRNILAEFSEFWFDKDYQKICFENKNLNAEVFGAYCYSERRDFDRRVERVFTVDDAKAAGLFGKSGPWQTYRKRMLQMKARGWALKDVAPEILLNVSQAEYDHDALVDPGGKLLTTPTEPEENVAEKLSDRVSATPSRGKKD